MTTLATTRDRERVAEIIREKSFRTGDFTLASGKKSSKYFNLKPTMMDPEGAYLCARLVLDALEPLDADFIGGLEMGAVPLVAAVAAIGFSQGRPVGSFFVRKTPKEHGAKLLVEGVASQGEFAGKRCVVIEDVTTTGGSALKAIEAVRASGGVANHAITLLDREEGAGPLMADNGITLHAVFRGSEFA